MIKKILNAILGLFIKPTLEERKKQLKEKLEKEIETTESDWVKFRNQSYLDLLENANGKVLDAIEKAIDKIKI